LALYDEAVFLSRSRIDFDGETVDNVLTHYGFRRGFSFWETCHNSVADRGA